MNKREPFAVAALLAAIAAATTAAGAARGQEAPGAVPQRRRPPLV